MKENAVRQLPSRRSSRVYGATETKRVNASGWSPTLASMIVRPLILAARSLAIATIVGSASFATIVAASPVVGAATASASGSDAISLRH